MYGGCEVGRAMRYIGRIRDRGDGNAFSNKIPHLGYCHDPEIPPFLGNYLAGVAGMGLGCTRQSPQPGYATYAAQIGLTRDSTI